MAIAGSIPHLVALLAAILFVPHNGQAGGMQPASAYTAGDSVRQAAIHPRSGEALRPTAAPEQAAAAPVEANPAAYPLALRSNLLFDLAGAPNIGVEVPLGRSFSVAGDFAFAFWRIRSLYAMQTIQGGIEGRYWFRQGEKPLTGWNAGLYGMYCSRYDVQWKEGYQGDGFWSAGVTAGYSTSVSRSLLLDFSLGAGYWFTPEVRHYHRPENGYLIWDETRYNAGRITLTKVRVNLVWLWGTKKTK